MWIARRPIAVSAVAAVAASLLIVAASNSGTGSAASLGPVAADALTPFSTGDQPRLPGFQATPSSVDFGAVELDITAGPTTVTVQNTGTGPLTFITGGVTLVGADPGQFSLTNDTCSSTTLVPSATCTADVSFTPTVTTGLKTASVRFENSLGAAYFVPVQGTGITPTNFFSLDPNPVTFGGVVVGDDSAIVVTLTKSGGPPITFTGFSTSGASAADYSVAAGTCTGTLSGNGSTCTFTVTFAPSASGSRIAILDIDFTRQSVPYLSQSGLSGTGLAPAFSASPSPVNFGTEDVGDTTPPTTVTVTNTGTAALNFGPAAVSIVGGNAGDFDIDADNCSNQNVAPSATCTVDVTFSPSASGSRTSSLRFTSNAASSPNDVTLNGTGATAPGFSAAPDPLAFGNQVVTTTSGSLTVTVTNTGNADLVLGPSAVSVIGGNAGDFDIDLDGCSNQNIAPSATCDVDVTFTPSATGPRSSNLRFVTNAASSPDDVALTGTGVNANAPAFSVAPPSFDFGNVRVGTNSAPETFTVTNTGNGDLVFGPSAVTITTGNAGDFAIVSDTCSDDTIAPAATCEVEVRFTPTATGVRSSQVQFISNAASSPDLAAVSGFGTQPVFSRTPASINFGDVFINSDTADDTITVTNTGDDTLAFTSISVSGANAADFTILAGGCQTLPNLGPGQSCVLTVQFDPSALGARNAQVDFVTDGGNGSTSLTGNGIPMMYTFVSDNFGTNGNLNGQNLAAGEWAPNPGAPDPGPWSSSPANAFTVSGNAATLTSTNVIGYWAARLDWDRDSTRVCTRLGAVGGNSNRNWQGILMHSNDAMTSGSALRFGRVANGGGGRRAQLISFTGGLSNVTVEGSFYANNGNVPTNAGIWCLIYSGGQYSITYNGSAANTSTVSHTPPAGQFGVGIYAQTTLTTNNTNISFGGTALNAATIGASGAPAASRFLVTAP